MSFKEITLGYKKSLRFILVKTIGQYINALSYTFPNKAISLSYALFSQPQKGKFFKKNTPTILLNTDQETHQYEDYHFQTYLWKGNNTKILLVHGWESNAARWEKALPYLQKSGSTIIALDAPAHGLSNGKEFNVPVYAEFINIVVQQHKPTIIIGHSIGGTACMYHQYLNPNTSLDKMVILGAPSDLSTLINNYIKMLSLNKKNFQLLKKWYLEHFNVQLEDFSAQKFAKSFTIEGILAHDEQDDVVALSEGLKVKNSWKNVHYIQTSGLGHGMHDSDLYQQIASYLFEAQQ